MTASQPIGIFDSGVGGLTVAKALHILLPKEKFIYFGDTLHMPYGDKSPEDILKFSKKIVDYFISRKVKLIIIACNTASSIAAGELRKIYWKKVEIIGVIRPVIKSIIENNISSLAIVGTQNTIQSNIYPKIISELSDTTIDLFQLATPLLAPLIEEGIVNPTLFSKTLATYLSHNGFKDKEAILLACTHYPLIKKEVDIFFENKKIIFDNATPLALEVKKNLKSKSLLASKKSDPNEFYVSKYTKNFETAAKTFYGNEIIINEMNL